MRRLQTLLLAIAVAACGEGAPTAPSPVPPVPAGTYRFSMNASNRTCPALGFLPFGLMTFVGSVLVTHENNVAVARPLSAAGGSFEMRFERWGTLGSIGETPVSGSFTGHLLGTTLAEFNSPALQVRAEGTSAFDGVVRLPLTFGDFHGTFALTVGQQAVSCPASSFTWTMAV